MRARLISRLPKQTAGVVVAVPAFIDRLSHDDSATGIAALAQRYLRGRTPAHAFKPRSTQTAADMSTDESAGGNFRFPMSDLLHAFGGGRLLQEDE